MVEIEIKAHITATKRKEILAICKSQFDYHGAFLKEDIYYNSKSSDKIFRIRREYSSMGKWETILNIKERNIIDNCECNNEIEFPIVDEKAFKKFIVLLGYREFIKKEKISYVYRHNGFSYEINNLRGLGDFIEIEYLTESKTDKELVFKKMEAILKEFDISPSAIETNSYISLLQQKGK